MPRIFGYARPVASEADAASQGQRLLAEGAEALFFEKGTPQARRALRERRKLFGKIEQGDTLILQSLDRLGTTLEDVLHSVAMLVGQGVTIKILEPAYDIIPEGDHRGLLQVLTGAHSALRSETIRIGVGVAQANGGEKPGTPPVLRSEQWPDIEARINTASLEAVAEELNVSRQTLWRYRRRMTGQAEKPAS